MTSPFCKINHPLPQVVLKTHALSQLQSLRSDLRHRNHAHADHSLDIRGDKDDPFSRGFICPKAVALQDLHYDKDRLKHPVRRTPHGWQRIGWDEAFDEVARNLKRIQAQHGRNAVATYLGNPTVHNYGAMLFAPGFIRSLHTRNKFSATSVDQLAHHLAAYLMFGHQLLLPVPDLDRTKFFLILGANPAASNGSLMTAPGMPQRLKEIRERGGKVILIDPRCNETAALVDRHLFIRPGTDVFLLLALLHVVFAEGLTRLGSARFIYGRCRPVRNLVASFLRKVLHRLPELTPIKYEPWRENLLPPNPQSAMEESASALKSLAACVSG